MKNSIRFKEQQDSNPAVFYDLEGNPCELSDLYNQIIMAGDCRDKENQKIDFDIIKKIHRADEQNDSFVCFAQFNSGNFHDLGTSRINELDLNKPLFEHHLLYDGRFTVNSSFAQNNFRKSKISFMPMSLRCENHLRYLNACYLDIDCYKQFINYREALKYVLEAIGKGFIPYPSYICYSGDGLYLLWLLREEDSNKPVKAFWPNIKKYKEINKRMANRLEKYKTMGTDLGAFDAARVLRAPGSIRESSYNPICRKTIPFIPLRIPNGDISLYTFKELASFLDISLDVQRPYKSKTGDQPGKTHNGTRQQKANNRINGYRAVGKHIIDDIHKICNKNGKIKKGRRRKTLTMLAQSARRQGSEKKEANKMLKEFASKHCQPRYPSDKNDTPIRTIVNSAWDRKPINYKNEYLANFFNITKEEAVSMGLRSIGRPNRKTVSNRSIEMLKRRQMIMKLIAESGNELSVRIIKQKLQTHNIKASVSTIYNDLKEIKDIVHIDKLMSTDIIELLSRPKEADIVFLACNSNMTINNRTKDKINKFFSSFNFNEDQSDEKHFVVFREETIVTPKIRRTG